MPTRRKRKLLITKTAELAFAVPLVVAHRITRMAIAGFSPTERDRKEFQRMGTEKTTAFIESWNAMAMQGIRANQALTASVVQAFWAPWISGKPSARAAMTRLHNAALGVIGKGMGPVHRRAVGNAKRLARTKLR